MALIDLDAYGAELELASPHWQAGLKIICVGGVPPPNAWRTFKRPLNWPEILKAMNSLFQSAKLQEDNVDVDFEDTTPGGEAPADHRRSLLVEASTEERMYLRARLALAGHTAVDDAASGADALELAARQPYDLVIVGLPSPDMASWLLIDQLLALRPALGKLVLTTGSDFAAVSKQAQTRGCHGVLAKPFDPVDVIDLLQTL